MHAKRHSVANLRKDKSGRMTGNQRLDEEAGDIDSVVLLCKQLSAANKDDAEVHDFSLGSYLRRLHDWLQASGAGRRGKAPTGP